MPVGNNSGWLFFRTFHRRTFNEDFSHVRVIHFLSPAGVRPMPAGTHSMPAGTRSMPAGIRPMPAGTCPMPKRRLPADPDFARANALPRNPTPAGKRPDVTVRHLPSARIAASRRTNAGTSRPPIPAFSSPAGNGLRINVDTST
jgi:hypothetical protein